MYQLRLVNVHINQLNSSKRGAFKSFAATRKLVLCMLKDNLIWSPLVICGLKTAFTLPDYFTPFKLINTKSKSM